MEYREGRCPKCREVMQIPVGRERIICMFCGQEFSPEEGREADEHAYETYLAQFEAHADAFFADVEKTVKVDGKEKKKKVKVKYREYQRDNYVYQIKGI